MARRPDLCGGKCTPKDRREAYPRGNAAIGHAAFSQNGEDLALFEQFFGGDAQPGTFVEMGALDGLTFSNTAAFEAALGWRGVLIEANPAMCAKLWKTRPLARSLCTAVSADYSVIQMEKGSFTATFGEVSEMDPAYKRLNHKHAGRFHQDYVPSAPLGQLLRMVGVASVDLFSLDVEGAELKVLQTFDWSIPVRVWCIEVLDHGRGESIHALMSSRGYVRTTWAQDRAPLNSSELYVWGNETELAQWSSASTSPGRTTWTQYEPTRLGEAPSRQHRQPKQPDQRIGERRTFSRVFTA